MSLKSFSRHEIINLLSSKGGEVLNLMKDANSKREHSHITFSKNVFLPLTELCRNDCGYCTFKKTPDTVSKDILMYPTKVLLSLKKAEKHDCKEALFTFGERPEEIKPVKEVLNKLGFANMVEYLYHICQETLNKTSLLPHSNPGTISYADLKMLKEVNASMGLMLETSSQRLMSTIAHEKSPGKNPWLRLQTIENAGKLKIPFTTGIIVGIGETLQERAESLLELRRIQDKYGHIQEIIIQNFHSKPGIAMEKHKEPSILEMIKTVCVARLIFPDISIQLPPNLNPETAQIFLMCGLDDWGGVSPLTPDFVNPEAPWPEIEELKKLTTEAGYLLKERLAVYPCYMHPEYLSEQILEKIADLKFYNLK